jgi:hypothetical protein
MTFPDEDVDPWTRILRALEATGDCRIFGSPGYVGREQVRGARPLRGLGGCTGPYGPPPHMSIQVVDCTDSTATIAWHDATLCRYDDQHWIRSTASRRGVCALTGQLIRRGADIFRPARRKSLPANADAMILAESLSKAASGRDHADEEMLEISVNSD